MRMECLVRVRYLTIVQKVDIRKYSSMKNYFLILMSHGIIGSTEKVECKWN